MATVNVREENRTLTDPAEIADFLEGYGIWYRRFAASEEPADDASDEEILAAYDGPIRELCQAGGYRTADVIDVVADTPGLQEMLDKFNREHWHDEDEVRFVVRGSGLFHINPGDGTIFSIEVLAGDMINVPRGTHHWFDLCNDRTIRCIRLFKDPSGWAPHYTGSGQEAGYQPLCLGPVDFPPAGSR